MPIRSEFNESGPSFQKQQDKAQKLKEKKLSNSV